MTGPRVDPLGILGQESDQQQPDPLGLLKPAGGTKVTDPGGDIDLGATPPPGGTPAPRPAAAALPADHPAAAPGQPGIFDRYVTQPVQRAVKAANDWRDQFAPENVGTVAQPIDRRTVTQQAAAARAQGAQLISSAASADVSGTPGAQILPSSGGAGTTTAAAMDASKTMASIKATAEMQGQFSPQHWMDIADRGMKLGSALHAQGKHDEAEDVLRKAYNAQLLANGAKQADTPGAIALSNLLGIVKDPFAQQRKNMAEIRANPETTFTPEEQQSMLGRNVPVATDRGFDVGKDVLAPLAGQAPLFELGGFAGRGAAAVAGAGAERLGYEGIGKALGRAASITEEGSQLGPRIPLSSPSMIRSRVEEEVSALRNQLPDMLGRGATQGQVVGAISTYRQARQQGATPEQALAAAAEGSALQVPMGAAAEIGMGIAGRLAGIGYDPIGRVWTDVRDRIRGTSPEEAVTTAHPAPTPTVDALRAQEGKLPASDQMPGLHRDIAGALDQLLGNKKEAAQAHFEDIFATPHPDEAPSGPDWWNAAVERGDVPRQDVGTRQLGPQEPAEPMIERPNVIGGRRRPEPPAAEPIPSALEAGMRRWGVEPAIRPTDEANAHFTMRRAAMDAEDHARVAAEEAQRALDDPNLRLEMAAQARPGEAQGPRTLEETLAEAKDRHEAGDPLATEYHNAINSYVDAAAAVRDAGEAGPNTRAQVAMARAKANLDAVRTKYGKQLGASAVLALAANNSDLSDEEKKMVGLGGLAVLSTDVVRMDEAHPLVQRVPFTSRLKSAIDVLPKAWDAARPAADWIGKLKGTTTFKKEELALLMPALEEAQRGKVKLTRDDVRVIAAEKLPQIKRVTLAEGGGLPEVSGDGGAGDPNDIHGLDTILADAGAAHADGPEAGHEYLQQQIDNRQARIDEIESRIEDQTSQARSDMEYAEREESNAHRELASTLEAAGLHRSAADAAIDYLNEHIEAEYIPRDAIDKALQMAIEDGDLRTQKNPKDLLDEQGWKIKEETKRPFTAEFTEADGTHHVEEMEYEGNETTEQVKQHLAEEFGVAADAIEITDHPEETEYVAYDYNDNEKGRGDDEDELAQEMVSDHGLDDEANDELWSEIKSDLQRIAEARAEYSRTESEHYWMTEGEAFSDEHEQIETMREEMQRIEAAQQELADRPIAGIPNAHALPEVAGQETGRPEGEPIAVVEAPDHEEPEQNVIPEVHGAPKYASYQRIGGGKNYREMLNVWSNNPGEDYKRNHYGNQGYQNVVGHVRAEDHQVYADLPGVTHDKVEISGDDPEPVRILKSHIVEVRKNRDKLIEQMNAVVRQHADLNEPEGIEAQDLARKYGDLNQRVIDLSKREDELDGKLSSALLNAGQGVHMDTQNVAVMIESQADWSQDAAKYGVKDPTAQARFNEIGGQMREIEAEMDLIERDEGTTSPHATPRWKELSAQLAELRDQQETIREAGNGNMVPTSPFIETQQAFTLNAARFLMDAAERGHDVAAWSDSANRVKNAHLPIQAAKLVYDDITPSAMKKLLNAVGFKDVPIRKMYIRGEGHWAIDLTPEMRKAIKRAGLPLLGVAAMTALPQKAEAQVPGGGSPGDLYVTALGGIAAGAALMYLAQNKKVRRIVKENRDLERALMIDDLSGLANKKAFLRARDGVNADEKFHWVVFDGDRFKKLNDVHGHGEGDKAIQHFGKTVMRTAEDMNIPMRGFRFGGDEIAFAAPAEHAAEFMRRVEEGSKYVKGDVTTKLTGGMGKTFDEADAMLGVTKAANRAADPSLRRPTDEGGAGGVTMYANPIAPAMRELMRYPGAAALAGVGALATQQDDPDIRATGKPLIALAALSMIGSRRLGAAKDFLADKLLTQMQKSEEGTAVARAFNPDALLHPDVRKAILDYENLRAKGEARANEFSGRAKELGPSGDRAVSDVIENENWEDVSNMSPKDMTAVLTFAASLEKEFSDLASEKVNSGVLDPLQLLPGYAGPRRYAHYEAADVLAEKRQSTGGSSTRIGAQKSRTLDEPIRDAQRELTAAQASGDKQRISDAQDALDQANAVQMSQRVERGEIRESSYRAAQGIQKGYNDVAAAKLFQQLRAQPGVAHPDWVDAVDDLTSAKQMRATATTPADRATADGLIRDAKVKIDEITRKYQQKGGEYVSLPDTPGLGALRGAVVQRDVANSLTGFTSKGLYAKTLRAWKNVKTIFNPGTHAANVISNITFAHMEGLPMWEQPLWLKRAAQDMRKYGPMTRALAESGVLGHNAVNAEGAGTVGRSMKSQEGLEELLGTTRPETADVLRKQGITEQAAARRARKRTLGYAAAGTALGAAKMYDEEEPGSSVAVGAGLGLAGGLAAAKFGRSIAKAYGSEDDIFRIAIGMKKMSQGMSLADAAAESKNALGNFRTRSPALQVLRSTIAPFVLYPAKVLPRFAAQVVDHPWRYMGLIALWGGLNEYSQQQEGPVPDIDVPPGQRRLMGYFLPGFTQLPMHGNQGERAATDMGRWTPLSAITTAAPPGSIPSALDENTPDVFRAGGPVVDLASKFGANVNPFTQKQMYKADYPARENIRHLLNDAAGTMLPSALDVHASNIRDDISNRDMDKLKNDALGPTGLRPRFIRPGANARAATFQLQQSLSSMKRDLTNALIANKNPSKVAVIQDRYLREVRSALANYRDRLGVEPPPALVNDALGAGRASSSPP